MQTEISTWTGGLTEKGIISVTVGTPETQFARDFINEDEAKQLINELKRAIRNINGKP